MRYSLTVLSAALLLGMPAVAAAGPSATAYGANRVVQNEVTWWNWNPPPPRPRPVRPTPPSPKPPSTRPVPELSVGGAGAALALLLGGAMMMAERRRREHCK